MRQRTSMVKAGSLVGVLFFAFWCVSKPSFAAEQRPTGLPSLEELSKTPPSQPDVGLPTDVHLDKTPPRATRGLDLVKMDWTYDCMECHRIVEVKWHRDRSPVEHQNITLDHGNNRFCLNCHNAKNMNAFVDYDGSEIAEQDVVLLCAKCHGTTYRDWKAGAHGRRNGHWSESMGKQTRLRCIQCHDPHRPGFQSMESLPPPRYPSRAAGAETPRGQAHSHP